MHSKGAIFKTGKWASVQQEGLFSDLYVSICTAGGLRTDRCLGLCTAGRPSLRLVCGPLYSRESSFRLYYCTEGDILSDR
jgi:hypothetical protein